MSAATLENNQPSNTDILVFKPETNKIMEFKIKLADNSEMKMRYTILNPFKDLNFS